MSKLSMKRKHRERRRKAEAGNPSPAGDVTPQSPAGDPAQRFERESRALLDLFNKRRFEEAIAEAERFIRRWPGHAFGYKLAGSACCELARFAEALGPLADAQGMLRVPYETVVTLARFG